MPCIEFPSILRAWAVLMAFNTIFFVCSMNFRWGLNQIPRYFIREAGGMVFNWPSLSVGIVILGLFLALQPVLVLVKCVSSFLTWSVLSPLSFSQVWASMNASLTSLVESAWFSAEAESELNV